MSSKKSKKQKRKPKSRAPPSHQKKEHKKSSPNNKLPKSKKSKTRIKITLNTPSRNEEKENITDHRRSKSPLAPFTDWYKSRSHKKSKPKIKKRRPQRSQSNRFYSEAPSKYKTKNKKEKLPKPHTPRNTQSKYKKKRVKNSHETDPKKQLKFTRKNDKITLDAPKLSHKKTKNKKKSHSPHTIAITHLSKSANSSPRNTNKNKKSTSKKKQSFAKRASLKFSSSKKTPRALSANPPNAKQSQNSSKSKSNRRGSFFSISRDKKPKNRSSKSQEKRNRDKIKKKRKNKSFKERIQVSIKPRTKNDVNVHKYPTMDAHGVVSVNKFGHNHEIQSSLTAHKLRMATNALREEIDDDDRLKLLDREDSSSLDPDGHNKYTMAIKFKQKRHHRRGSSGIPHFYQKKLAFEQGQYLDEKARLFISHFCRLYGLRIPENLFEIISRFHVMPFDCGFICITSKDDDKYSSITSVTYYNPVLQMPVSSLSKLLGATDGIMDDRLSAMHNKMLEKHRSVPVAPQSAPVGPRTRNRSKSFNHINERKRKQKGFIVKAPTNKAVKTISAENIAIGLAQSQSLTAYFGEEEFFCEDIGVDKCKKKQQDLMKIKKYKKRATKKRKKNIGGRLTRSTTYHSDENKKKIKKAATRIFYSSASELSDTETYTDIDLSAEAHDGFSEINYTELLHENSLPQNTMSLQEDTTLSEHSITVEYSGTLSVNKLFTKATPILNEDTNTNTTLNTTFNTTTNDTANTMTQNKTAELFTDYSPPPSPKGYRSEDTMTPRSMTMNNDNINFFKEFKVSFDEEDSHIISHPNKMKRMNKKWIGLCEDITGIGIAEWTLLSTPKVFDYHNHFKRNELRMQESINCLSPRLGIGGFIDRTRGVCGVSLAPIYYRYGGMDKEERYCNKLDIYNLYSGDYISSCSTLPFTNLYDTSSCMVREGYKASLIITGGQYYGEEIFDDSIIESKTYFYAPWINSHYHHQLSEQNNNNKQRRKSITDKNNKNKNKIKRVSRQFINQGNTLFDFENIVTRPSARSIAITSPSTSIQIQKQQKEKEKEKENINEKIKEKILSDGNWILGPEMIKCRASHSSVSWDEHIVFCCGGIGKNGRRISSVEMLRMDRFKQLSDLNKLRWRKCSSMSANKSNLVLIHWKPKTCIVCVGSGSKVVESYDPYKDNWKDLPPLNTHQVSSKSCRFYYDNEANNNCLIFVKFRNGVIKCMEYLDERKKLKKWTQIKDQYVELFNVQINKNNNHNNHNNKSVYLKNIQPFCFS